MSGACDARSRELHRVPRAGEHSASGSQLAGSGGRRGGNGAVIRNRGSMLGVRCFVFEVRCVVCGGRCSMFGVRWARSGVRCTGGGSGSMEQESGVEMHVRVCDGERRIAVGALPALLSGTWSTIFPKHGDLGTASEANSNRVDP